MKQKKQIINDGTESTVSLMISDNGARLVTKMRRPHGKTQYLFEAYAYTKLGSLGARVPVVKHVSEKELTMSALNGRTLDDLMHLYNNDALFESIAKDLSLNMKVIFAGYGKPILDEGVYRGKHREWIEFLNVTLGKIKSSKLFNSKQKKSLVAQWEERINSIQLDQGALVHGDFSLNAIFVKDDVYEGIIDYGDAFIGDPLMDLAYFRFKEINKPYGFKIYELLANSYASNALMTRGYIDKAVDLYMIYWAVERVHADNINGLIINKFIDKTNTLLDKLSQGVH